MHCQPDSRNKGALFECLFLGRRRKDGFEELEDFVAREAQVEKASDRVAHDAVGVLVARLRFVGPPVAHECAHPPLGADVSLALELMIGFGDRVGVDEEVAGEVADGGHLLALFEFPGGDHEPELVPDLNIDGDFAFQIEVDVCHISSEPAAAG